MTTEESNPVSRRSFCRTLALPAGAMVLGSALPAWARRNKQEKPSTPAQQDSEQPKSETKVLWDFGGCIEDRFMDRVSTYVYNGNVYLWVLLPEFKTTIVKVPLDGSTAQMYPLMPGHTTGHDPHRYYRIAADSLGYIHVCGDMHSSPFVKHWISKRPEDISEFVFAAGEGSNRGPQGLRATYPHFYRSPDGVLYHIIRSSGPPHWGLCLSVLDVKTQTWTALASNIPKADGGKSGHPFTVWEDKGEGGLHGYTQPHHSIFWGRDKRMHLAFAVLNANTPSAQGRHTLSDVLYAYSDDGGKTFHRGDGSKIPLPMRADRGPHQGDLVYSEHEGPPPWLELRVQVRTDEQNRPVVSFSSHRTGDHSLVLEKGKWIERKGATSHAGNQTAKNEEEDEEKKSDEVGAHPHLPYEIHRQNSEYLRDTGNHLFTTFPEKDRFHGNKPKHHRIMLVLSKPVQATKDVR
jgi:hypothetical protein